MTTMTDVDEIDLSALGDSVAAALAERPPEPATDGGYEAPKFDVPKLECEPSVMEVITGAVEKVLTGNHKTTVEKRKKMIDELSQGLADLRVYGVEIEGARVPIGDGADFGNAVVETDGYGEASTVWAFGIPIWDPQ